MMGSRTLSVSGEVACALLGPQRFHQFQVGGPVGRIQPEEKAYCSREETVASRMESMPITGLRCVPLLAAICLTKGEISQPSRMPRVPPNRISRTDSLRNWPRISLLRAPRALRSPISRVRLITALWESIPPRADGMLEGALEITCSGLDETRRALQDPRATILEEMGLALALRMLADETSARSGFSLLLDIPEQIGDLTPDVEQCFNRVALEALENIDKHAVTAEVLVRLKRENNLLALTVSDDGAGFVPSQEPSDRQFDLTRMRERAELVGAY